MFAASLSISSLRLDRPWSRKSRCNFTRLVATLYSVCRRCSMPWMNPIGEGQP
jgi:hypothetical protein